MNILLNLSEDIVEKYQELAKLEKRSRKNLMEKVLTDFFESPPPTKPKEPEKQFQESYSPEPTKFKTEMERKANEIRQQFLKR